MAHDVITFGCRLNTYESEVIRDALADSGHKEVAVFNTCAVTAEAERQARQAIRKYRREHPDAHIVVTGCSAQINPKQYADLPEVDLVLGNEEKMKAESYKAHAHTHEHGDECESHARPTLDISTTEKVLVNDIMSVKETASHLVTGFDDRSRAFIQVQNGCNHRCTFCIIPYGRGNSRSVPVGEVVAQVRVLVENGFNEIVLTGVDVSDYGSDLPGQPRLSQLIRRVLALVPTLPRLRLSSIDVAEIDDELLDLIANEPRLMPHLHLSLQSGDDMILKRMKRRHSRAQIIDFAHKARSLRSDVVFGADIIAGFPTETDEMFENTLNIVREADLTYLHIFPYSERKGTPAAEIPANKQVPVPMRKARAAALRAAGEAQLSHFLKTQVGREVQLVMEKENTGRSEHFALARLEGAEGLQQGALVRARVTGAEADRLLATIL